MFGIRCRKITNKSGEAAAILYLLHDMTERKQRDRLKSEFIAVLSHELKTPLQSLGTAAELLMKRREEKSDEERMLIETIHEDTARIRAIAEDFMQVSFVDHHSLKLKIGRHALSELLQEWVKPFRVVGRDRKVDLEFVREPSGVVWADIDAVKFPWAISNLLSNALRFSPPESKVTVCLKGSDSRSSSRSVMKGQGFLRSCKRGCSTPIFRRLSARPPSLLDFSA